MKIKKRARTEDRRKSLLVVLEFPDCLLYVVHYDDGGFPCFLSRVLPSVTLIHLEIDQF
jgi:hypothetical protein